MNLATEIKEARAKLGYTQEEAAQAWGINIGTLRQYEQGQRTPRGLAMTALRGILAAAMADNPPPPVSSASVSPTPQPRGANKSKPSPPKRKRARLRRRSAR